MIDQVSWFCSHGQIFSGPWAFLCMFPSVWNALPSLVLCQLLLISQNPALKLPHVEPFPTPDLPHSTCILLVERSDDTLSFLLFLPLFWSPTSLGSRLYLSLPVWHLGSVFSQRCGEDQSPVLVTISHHTQVKTVAFFSLPSASKTKIKVNSPPCAEVHSDIPERER